MVGPFSRGVLEVTFFKQMFELHRENIVIAFRFWNDKRILRTTLALERNPSSDFKPPLMEGKLNMDKIIIFLKSIIIEGNARETNFFVPQLHTI